MKRLFFITSLLFSIIFFEKSQAQCLNETQLLKMFKTNLNDIKDFMNNESWYYEGIEDNVEIVQYNCKIKLQKIEWSRNNDKLQLYQKNNKIYILKFTLYNDGSCIPSAFSNIALNLKPKQYSLEEAPAIISEITKNGLVFQMSIIDSYSGQDLTIFNYLLVNNLVQIEKKKEKEQKIKQEEKNKKFNQVLSFTDLLEHNNKYELAIIEYKKNIDLFPENQSVIEERIMRCENEFKNFVVEKGDSLMNESNYKEALSFYNKFKNYNHENEEINEKINNCLKKHYDLIIAEGDNLVYKNMTEDAINRYKEAYSLGLNKFEIDSKIKLAIQKKNDKITNGIVKEAVLLESNKDYYRAINKYLEIYFYDKDNYIATVEIKRLKDLLAFLNKRLTYVYDYSDIQPSSFLALKTYLSDEFNHYISTKPNGNLDLQYKVSFDTLGINNSVYDINSNNKSIIDILNGNNLTSILKPSTINKYFVASESKLDINLNWTTDNVNVTSSKNGLIYSNTNYINNSNMGTFISSQIVGYGTYKFGVTHKTYNGKEYEDIILKNYTVRGPENFVYSAIMPGWGTRRVTYGEKGWGTTLSFLGSVGLSMGCLIYGAFEGDDNIMYSGLAAGGIAGSIYLIDIISVINKGFKNLTNSSSFRQNLREHTIMLKNEKIEIH